MILYRIFKIYTVDFTSIKYREIEANLHFTSTKFCEKRKNNNF